MPISWNEIKDRALKFSHEWVEESSEDAEAKSFWDAFFNVFGVPRRRVATFEHNVKKIDGKDGYIDLLWRGILLVEHKSLGKDLDRAYQQAKDYFPGIKDADLPRYILVSDFARFRLYDLEENTEQSFVLKDLHKNIRLFGFIAGYQTTSFKEQDPVNIKAAEKMGKLHDSLKVVGYEGHNLEAYLVRLLFCLFADNTSIFDRRQFQDLIEQRTSEDGQDLAQWLDNLFQVLDTPKDKRLKTLDEQLSAFEYVNGSLFAERLPTAAFNHDMRDILIECCALDWSRISPAIFGALFQSVMDQKLRRNLGAHYTSEKNILKLIKPLFLDELREEFERIKSQRNQQEKKLLEFRKKIASLKFLDPACGCGNFLVIAYRELRELELDVLRSLYPRAATGERQTFMDVSSEIQCDVDQFYGIEIEEFPAQIAQTALWLMDHQMNMLVSEEFGQYFRRLPLKKSATIVYDNALLTDWSKIIESKNLNYILGNPPFVGKKEQNTLQKSNMAQVFGGTKGVGVLDLVTAWYRKSTEYMLGNRSIKSAFVSTNSIAQGEQVGILWADLFKRGTKIHFAHRTFQWSNEASGKAAVHCVIIGFAVHDSTTKWIFDYDSPRAEAHGTHAQNINPYLVDAPDIVITRQSTSISSVPEISYGSMAIDDGHLLLTDQERKEIIQQSPNAEKYIRPFMGGEEFLNNGSRWCLWLNGMPPSELKTFPLILNRVEAVRKYRLSSNRETTVKLANFPMAFGENRQPNTQYLLIPKVSSESRQYLPIGFCEPHIIASGSCLVIKGATLYHFGVLTSAMHMGWMRYTAGRMKSDYQYSAGIVYNNFPWPNDISNKHKQAIEEIAQNILDIRARYRESTFADLYNPLSMPPDLIKAHQKLDAAVDAAYSKRKFSGDSDRVAFLFELYQQTANPLEARKNIKRPTKTAGKS